MKMNTSSPLRSKIRWGIAGIFILLALSIAFDVPQFFNKGIGKVNAVTGFGLPNLPEKKFRLGLDLQGGAHLIYQANVENIPNEDRSKAVEGVRDVIERRVNGLGVAEPNIQTTRVGDAYRLIVELPGVTDVNKAIQLIGGTPILEFKEQNDQPARDLTSQEKKDIETFNAQKKKQAETALSELKQNPDFNALVQKYSEDAESKAKQGSMGYLKSTDPFAEVYKWAQTAKEGDVSQTIIESKEGFHIVKRGKERDGQKEYEARHILICYIGARGCDNGTLTKDEARKKAEEIKAKINNENFVAIAKESSMDLSTKDSGGNLGALHTGDLANVSAVLEKAYADAKVGEMVGPVETEFGYHVIQKVNEKTLKEYELSQIFFDKKTAEEVLPPADPWKNTGLSGKQLKRAEVVTDPQTGTVQVSLKFNEEGTELFKQITERNIQKPIAIFLDGEAISAPNVDEVIPNGEAIIRGRFSLPEAQLLAQRLNAGALPVPVELVSQQSIGATLGEVSLLKSLKAGVIAVLLIMIFMVLYYRLPGFVAVVALTLYIALSLALFKLIGVTLTLAGITGFILSIGIAVDANVLIFERLKEELRLGKSLRAAVEEGFLRAWTSIRDGNVSTLITCVLLIWFGTSFVKGFALTLMIGILVSIFTAVTVTRILLRFVIPWFQEKGNWMFLGAQKTKE